ncbi:MAG: phage NrS-1 polymerase family protein [Burkholderiaceae bacterium]
MTPDTRAASPLAPLAALRQFIAIRFVPLDEGKTDKLPLTPQGTLTPKGQGGAHNPAYWQSWAEAHALATRLGPGHGVGFVMQESNGLFCIDIDNCVLPGGGYTQIVHDLAAQLGPHVVWELSQSGRGLHLWMRATLPEHRKKNVPLGLEGYTGKRFIALGTAFHGDMDEPCPGALAVAARYFPPNEGAATVPQEGPVPEWRGPADDDELLRRAMQSSSKRGMFGGQDTRVDFADLWNANEDALRKRWPDPNGGYDASSADAALAAHLAFWTGKDVARIERLMRRSALAREKWDSRSDYLVDRTIVGACAKSRDVLVDNRSAAESDPPELVRERALSTAAAATVAPPGPQSLRDALSRLGMSTERRLPAELGLVQAVLEPTGIRVRFDRFLGREIVTWAGLPGCGGPRPLEPDDLLFMRRHLEGPCNFKKVGADLMADAVRLEGRANEYDSAQEWLAGLPAWDGVPRVDAFVSRHFGVPDDAYSRVAGRYFWTAAAGRVLQPGVKADAALVLVGAQGMRKSTAIAALAPTVETFGELDLAASREDRIRLMRGKLIVELPELAGLSRREVEEIKAFLSSQHDEYVEKFQPLSRAHPRRCVFVGSTNESAFLVDATGNRRWLPVEVVRPIDVDALRCERDQLWAEGGHLFRQHGVMCEGLDTLSGERAAAHTAADPWDAPVQAWLSDQVALSARGVHAQSALERTAKGNPAVSATKVLELALHVPRAQATPALARRVGHAMRRAGWDSRTVRLNGADRPVTRFMPVTVAD